MQPKNVPCLIPELANPKFRLEALQSFSGRTRNRTRIDKMQRFQRDHRRLTKAALRVLADPAATIHEQGSAHGFLDGHRQRITALERTHGRAMHRDVLREQLRTNRTGQKFI